MLSGDVLIQDIDPAGWINLLRLTDPQAVRLLAGDPPRPSTKKTRLTVVFDGPRVIKSHHSVKGSILDGFTWDGPSKLRDIAQREDVHSVVAVERGALGRIFKRFQNNISLRDDYVKQLLAIYDAVRRETGKGLRFYPPVRLRPIRYEMVRNFFNLIFPHNSTVVFYVFDKHQVWSSAIIGVNNDGIDLFTSHLSLEDEDMSVGNWREDYPLILSAVDRKFRRPSIGIFCELTPLVKVIRAGKKLAALARAREKKDIIVDPLPLRIKMVLGAGRLLGR